MSLSKIGSIVKNQFLYKLKLYSGLFYPLVIVQGIALVFSLNGSGQISSSSYGFIRFYSADIVLAFTFIWAFISAVQLTTKPFRENDVIFVFNRFTSNVSNLLFLFLASIVGAITTYLSGYFLKVVVYLFFDSDVLGAVDVDQTFILFAGIISSIFYIFMFASLGYLVGTLVQWNKIFAIVIPAFVLGALFLVVILGSEAILRIGQFYFFETSFVLVISKTFLTAGIAFIVSIIISNKMEVRK